MALRASLYLRPSRIREELAEAMGGPGPSERGGGRAASGGHGGGGEGGKEAAGGGECGGEALSSLSASRLKHLHACLTQEVLKKDRGPEGRKKKSTRDALDTKRGTKRKIKFSREEGHREETEVKAERKQ